MKNLKFCQSKAIIRAKDKNVDEAMQFANNELELQCIWKTFLQTQKNILVLGKIWKIAGYIDSYNANSKQGQLYETRLWYLNMTCSRYMTNKKNLFIKKFLLNTIKL